MMFVLLCLAAVQCCKLHSFPVSFGFAKLRRCHEMLPVALKFSESHEIRRRAHKNNSSELSDRNSYARTRARKEKTEISKSSGRRLPRSQCCSLELALLARIRLTLRSCIICEYFYNSKALSVCGSLRRPIAEPSSRR